MPLVEVDEAEVQKLKAERDQAVAHKLLLDKLGSSPKTRRQILSLIKELDPNVQIPELDATKPLEDKIAALEKLVRERGDKEAKESEEQQKRTAAAKAEKHFEDGKKLLKKAGFTDEGIGNVEKFMADRGLVDYEAALALWEKDHPRDEPVMPANFGRDLGLFSPPKDNPWADAVKLPKGRGQDMALRKAQNDEINAWFRETRGAR